MNPDEEKVEMEGYRKLMRFAKDAKTKAEYKRKFRKARNRYYLALTQKEKPQVDKGVMK